jgi:PilZ domain-containing protein
MRISRTNFDRQEGRRDRRYASPPLTITIGEQEYVSDNWSLGGFQLSGPLPLELGAAVTGTFQIDGSDGFAFTASVVRHEGDSFGFHFHELSPQAMTKLDRALARRLVIRRRPS